MEQINNHIEDVFFSIIIPVYNVENYLKQCLETVLIQNYATFEVILINDGSTDSSLELCKSYQEKYNKIQLIDQKNGGLSDARNKGLLAAKGEYVIFTDSDDYWEGNDVLKDLNNLIKESNPDVIIHEESRYFSEKDVYCKYNQRFIKNKTGNFEDEIIDLVYYDLFNAAAWDKVIKRSILIDNNLFFPYGKKSEDIEWCGRLMHFVKSFTIYSKSFYIYRQVRKDSITTSVTENHILDVYSMVKNGLNATSSNSENLNKAIQNYWAFHYVIILKDFYVLSFTNRKEIWKDLVSWKYLLQRKRNVRVDQVMNFYQYLSFKLLILFLNGYRIKTILYKKYRTIK